MTTLTVYKKQSLPNKIEANTLYLIAPPDKPNYIEMYVSSRTGEEIRRIPTTDDIRNMIISFAGEVVGGRLDIVTNIAMRDALEPSGNSMVMVLDATGDPTVSSGAATYIFEVETNTWHKISETESIDMVIDWDNLQNKPNAVPVLIDDAVNKRHSHANITQLSKIGQDLEGNLTYNGAYPKVNIDVEDW